MFTYTDDHAFLHEVYHAAMAYMVGSREIQVDPGGFCKWTLPPSNSTVAAHAQLLMSLAGPVLDLEAGESDFANGEMATPTHCLIQGFLHGENADLYKAWLEAQKLVPDNMSLEFLLHSWGFVHQVFNDPRVEALVESIYDQIEEELEEEDTINSEAGFRYVDIEALEGILPRGYLPGWAA